MCCACLWQCSSTSASSGTAAVAHQGVRHLNAGPHHVRDAGHGSLRRHAAHCADTIRAQQFEQVKQTLKYGVITGGLITTAGFLAGQFAPEIVSRMFTDDAGLIALSVEGMRLATLVFPLVGIQIVVGNFFQSIGKAKLSIFLSLTRQLLFLAPCLLILPRFFELKGIWISLPVSDSLSFVTSMGVLYMFFGRPAHHSREA